MKSDTDIKKDNNEKEYSKRRFRLSSIIIWTVLIVVVVLSFLTNSQTQRINNEIILLSVADQLGKNISQLTDTDYAKITRLDLSHSAATDISLLKKFPNLLNLDLGNTPLELDNTPPQWKIVLARWHILKIDQRGKIDLSPLKKLRNLQKLNLCNANIKSTKPLAYLTNLKELILPSTEISDFRFLKEGSTPKKLVT